MKTNNQLLNSYLLRFYSKEYADEIREGIKNPAKNSWIYNELISICKRLESRKDSVKKEEILIISEILEDELVNVLLISQNSKCNPFKSINTNQKKRNL
ncbi:MAG: hypothetical protein JW776_08365 [Candidatus Lokiarchaeota archaeon]|nr:hypothetical protein [Candidatus Lokiarchaeota archaeon]